MAPTKSFVRIARRLFLMMSVMLGMAYTVTTAISATTIIASIMVKPDIFFMSNVY